MGKADPEKTPAGVWKKPYPDRLLMRGGGWNSAPFRGHWWERGGIQEGEEPTQTPRVSCPEKEEAETLGGGSGQSGWVVFRPSPWWAPCRGVDTSRSPAIPAETETDLRGGSCRICRWTGKNARPACLPGGRRRSQPWQRLRLVSPGLALPGRL